MNETIRNELKNSWALEKEKILNSLSGTTQPGTNVELENFGIIQVSIVSSLPFPLNL
jgi:hypothetical protein